MSWKIIVGGVFTLGLLMLLYSIPTRNDVVGPIGVLLLIVSGFIIWLYSKLR